MARGHASGSSDPLTTVDPELFASSVALYERLHAHPELSGEEHAIAATVESELSAAGFEVFRCAGTGVVGVLRNGVGRTVAYRADLDALPVAERSGLAYASTVEVTRPDGTRTPVMHACGHDMHTAVALGAAATLSRQRASWSGTVVFIFQPSEETGLGARAMVEDGLWDRAPVPDVLLAQHVRAIANDTVQVESGDVMSLADTVRVTFHGRSAHASKPEDALDPVVLAAHAVVRLQSIVSREISPRTPTVITVSRMSAGVADNVIADRAELTLSIRTATEADRDHTLAAVTRVLTAEAAASDAPPPTIEVVTSFPRCYNDPQETEVVAAALEAEFGDQLARGVRAPASEDVGWLVQDRGIPLVYSFFGAYAPGRESMPPNHTPRFAPDAEGSLRTGLRAALIALRAQLAPRSAD